MINLFLNYLNRIAREKTILRFQQVYRTNTRIDIKKPSTGELFIKEKEENLSAHMKTLVPETQLVYRAEFHPENRIVYHLIIKIEDCYFCFLLITEIEGEIRPFKSRVQEVDNTLDRCQTVRGEEIRQSLLLSRFAEISRLFETEMEKTNKYRLHFLYQ